MQGNPAWSACGRHARTSAQERGQWMKDDRNERAARVLSRRMASREVGAGGVTRLIDAVAVPGTPARVLAFFGNGTQAAAFAPDAVMGCALPLDLREVSGAAMVAVVGDGPVELALSEGGRLRIEPARAEPELLAGLDCLLAFRLEETVAQMAEMLRYHATHYGLQGAVVICRVPPDDDLAASLKTAIAGTALTVVLVEAPVPLGKPGLAAETHPILAPDAPGKDRMAAPPPDPWRAPLGEALCLEAMKWRFLSQARTVLCLDMSDFLDLEQGAFDLCAAEGAVLLVGRRVYPWRVREGAEARLGDHICRPFDQAQGFTRWGCAPGTAGLASVWRIGRVSYAKPARTVTFNRAMAVRVPGQAVADLVPKSSLVEDAGLLALSHGAFGAKPVRPPQSRPKAAPAQAVQGGRTAVVTTMKNEGPFILEWLAYHRAIGVDDFLIYTNDCTDGTDTMLDLLQARGLVQHRDNPFRGTGLKPQHAALQAAEAEPVMRTCGWGICMDVDEFIAVKVGDGTLGALYEAMGDANMIALTWRLFGNAEVHGYADRPVTEQFTRCAPEVIRKPHQAWGFKTLFRNIDIYRKLGVHRPKGLIPDLWDRVAWLNGSGRPMPRSMIRNGWRSTLESYGYDWVQLNHYAVRSVESFLVKRDRGRVNHVDREQGLNYWFRMNHNLEEDRAIQRMMSAAEAERAALMADPEIAAAHEACVHHHRAKIADLMGRDDSRAIHAALTAPRMERLCRLQQHFGAAVFLAGPQVIPNHIPPDGAAEDWFYTVAPAET